MDERDRIAALAEGLRTISARLKRRLREQGSVGDFSQSQISVIVQLEKIGSATVSALARAENMRAQSMSAIVGPLQSAGLVESRPDPEDGRQVLLSLSEDCRRALVKGRAARQDWLSHTIAERLSAAEQDELAQALGLLRRLLD